MRKCNITVYDYCDARHGSVPLHCDENEEPFKYEVEVWCAKYEVEAWCVGGPEGVKAFFVIDHMVYTADGDDGHWWLTGKFHKEWLKEIKEAITSISDID